MSPETLPPIEYTTVHVTATVVTAAALTVPLPLATVHCWLAGCVFTVTAYAAPLARAVLKLKAPVDETVESLPALFCSTTLLPDLQPGDGSTDRVGDRRGSAAAGVAAATSAGGEYGRANQDGETGYGSHP